VRVSRAASAVRRRVRGRSGRRRLGQRDVAWRFGTAGNRGKPRVHGESARFQAVPRVVVGHGLLARRNTVLLMTGRCQRASQPCRSAARRRVRGRSGRRRLGQRDVAWRFGTAGNRGKPRVHGESARFQAVPRVVVGHGLLARRNTVLLMTGRCQRASQPCRSAARRRVRGRSGRRRLGQRDVAWRFGTAGNRGKPRVHGESARFQAMPRLVVWHGSLARRKTVFLITGRCRRASQPCGERRAMPSARVIRTAACGLAAPVFNSGAGRNRLHPRPRSRGERGLRDHPGTDREGQSSTRQSRPTSRWFLPASYVDQMLTRHWASEAVAVEITDLFSTFVHHHRTAAGDTARNRTGSFPARADPRPP